MTVTDDDRPIISPPTVRPTALGDIIDHDGDGNPITVSDVIVRALRAGNYAETAADLAGVETITVRDWLSRGARVAKALTAGKVTEQELHPNDRKMLAFAAAARKAMAESEAFDVANLAALARGGRTKTTRTTRTKQVDGKPIVEEVVKTEDLGPDISAITFRLSRRHGRRWGPHVDVDVHEPESAVESPMAAFLSTMEQMARRLRATDAALPPPPVDAEVIEDA